MSLVKSSESVTHDDTPDDARQVILLKGAGVATSTLELCHLKLVEILPMRLAFTSSPQYVAYAFYRST